jgi:hypothetical protein
MMILKAQFSESEVESFFRKNGFTVIPHKRGNWRPSYHNQQEWVEVDIPGLVVPCKETGRNQVIDALKLFERVAEKRLKGLVLGTDVQPVQLINEALIEYK